MIQWYCHMVVLYQCRDTWYLYFLKYIKLLWCTMKKRAHLVHPGITLGEQTYILLTQLKKHPTLDTLCCELGVSFIKLAKGSVTWVKVGQQHPCIYKKICLVIALNLLTFCDRLQLLMSKWLHRAWACWSQGTDCMIGGNLSASSWTLTWTDCNHHQRKLKACT